MNLKEKLKGKTIEECNSYIKDKEFKIISNLSGSGIPIGTIVTITSIQTIANGKGGSCYGVKSDKGKSFTGYCWAEELDIVNSDTISGLKELNTELEEQLEKIEVKIKENCTKIKFMEDNNLDKFDETDFKVYKTLNILESPTLSKIERVKAIAKLIKN